MNIANCKWDRCELTDGWNWSVQMCCYKFASLQAKSELQDCYISIYFLDSMTTQKQLLYPDNTENYAGNVPFAVAVCGTDNQSAASVSDSSKSPSISPIFWFDAQSQSLLDSFRSFCFFFLLLFWFDGFWTPDDNEMKARAWWNTVQVLRLSLMDNMSLLCWAWPAHRNSPKARSPFVSIALFAYILPFYVPTSVTLLISFAILLFPLNFPPFLPVAAINLEKLPKIIRFHYEPPWCHHKESLQRSVHI